MLVCLDSGRSNWACRRSKVGPPYLGDAGAPAYVCGASRSGVVAKMLKGEREWPWEFLLPILGERELGRLPYGSFFPYRDRRSTYRGMHLYTYIHSMLLGYS